MELFVRHESNPVLTADHWPIPVNSVFNPGATVFEDSTIVLARVEDRCGLSHLWVARSANGIDGWVVDPEPLLSPNPLVPTERWGFEDPRITYVPELERFVITCTSYGPSGPAVFLASTADFQTVKRHGVVMPPEDKNAALLPHRVHGAWLLFHRPVSTTHGSADIWLSRSPDLVAWRAPEPVLRCRPHGWWDAARIGMGPPPIETDEGWLVIYHGVRTTMSGSLYRVGLALLDRDNPAVVLRRSPGWVLSPQAPCERVGDVPNVVFPCGAVVDSATDELRLYYGAADTSVCVATARVTDLVDHLRQSELDPQD